MEVREYAGKTIQTSADGYLKNLNEWDKEVAAQIANEEEIALEEKHWEVINFLQSQFRKEVPLTIRKIGKSGVVDIKQFYSLFPNGPLKKASRIAGIPKPASCI